MSPPCRWRDRLRRVRSLLGVKELLRGKGGAGQVSDCKARAASATQAPEGWPSAALCPLPATCWPPAPLLLALTGLLSVQPSETTPLGLKALQEMGENSAFTSAHSFKYTHWPIFTDLIVYKIPLCAIPTWIFRASHASWLALSPRLGYSWFNTKRGYLPDCVTLSK